MIAPDEALPGRDHYPFRFATTHAVLGTSVVAPYPDDTETIGLGMGCFWGAEEIYWQLPGVHVTAVGYQGGYTPHPTYQEVCTGRTGHAEVVQVVYRPAEVSTLDILRPFWEQHDPTQGYRQGNDIGTQYRSAIFWTTEEQRLQALRTAAAMSEALRIAQIPGTVTTEIAPARDHPFYFAEDDHQAYLHKVPGGYRCHSSTGVSLPDLG